MKPVTLHRGNCLVFAIKFKWHNPSAKIVFGWNYISRVPSFSCLLNGKQYFYKRRDRRQWKYWFNGKVVIK
jgi:hypothetical protein